MNLDQKLTFAITINANRIRGQSQMQENILARGISEQDGIEGAIARGERLLKLLTDYASAAVNRPLQERIEAGKVLAAFAKQHAADPAVPLVREFYTSSDGDYDGSTNASQPIDESKVKGVSGEVLFALRCAEIEVEWLPRTNGYKASFQLKVS